jgi:hypothetical protein
VQGQMVRSIPSAGEQWTNSEQRIGCWIADVCGVCAEFPVFYIISVGKKSRILK